MAVHLNSEWFKWGFENGVNSGRNDPSHSLPTPQYLYNHPYEEQGYYYYVKLLHFLFLNMNIMSMAIGVINTITMFKKSPISTPFPTIVYLHQYHQHNDTTYYVNHSSTPLSNISLCNSLFS